VKIDNVIKSTSVTRGKESRASSPQPSKSGEAMPISDQVQLTATSEKMRHLESELAQISINDAAKIESIRQAIADGSFKVDEQAVADGLINESIVNIGHR
jgi:negative regulator of flagellin synthesis FlgM